MKDSKQIYDMMNRVLKQARYIDKVRHKFMRQTFKEWAVPKILTIQEKTHLEYVKFEMTCTQYGELIYFHTFEIKKDREPAEIPLNKSMEFIIDQFLDNGLNRVGMVEAERNQLKFKLMAE